MSYVSGKFYSMASDNEDRSKLTSKYTVLDNSSMNYRKMKQEMGMVVSGEIKM